MLDIKEVQDQLDQAGLDGWLFYDFQGLNPIARKLVGVQSSLLTRRWYFWIPRSGQPVLLCHQIEQNGFASLNTRIRTFKSWNGMMQSLKQILEGCERVAMEYSPLCSIPYVSRVDAGTIQAIEQFGTKVVSSANLVQYFQSRWSGEQYLMHLEASQILMSILFTTFQEIGQAIRSKRTLTEYSVQQAMLHKFQNAKLVTGASPIIAANENTGNPHYEPSPEKSKEIRSGDFVLLDFWAKLDKVGAVYADYTWVAILSDMISDEKQNIWEVVKGARDAAIDFVRANYPARSIQGWQVDAIARSYIADRRLDDYFIHRTGHNIGEEDHGYGANMDNLETKDERLLIANTCFSIEPGVYLPAFGMRSEVNVYLGENEIVVTGDPVQSEIFKISV